MLMTVSFDCSVLSLCCTDLSICSRVSLDDSYVAVINVTFGDTASCYMSLDILELIRPTIPI